MKFYIVMAKNPIDSLFEYFIINEDKKIVHYKAGKRVKDYSVHQYVVENPVWTTYLRRLNRNDLHKPKLLTAEELFIYLL